MEQTASSIPQERIASWDNIGNDASVHFDPKTQVYGENNKPYGTIRGLFAGQISFRAYFWPKTSAREDAQATLEQAKADIKAAYPRLTNADSLIAKSGIDSATKLTGSTLKGLKATFESALNGARGTLGSNSDSNRNTVNRDLSQQPSSSQKEQSTSNSTSNYRSRNLAKLSPGTQEAMLERARRQGPDQLQNNQEDTNALNGVLSKTTQNLEKRGETLRQLADKSARLKNIAGNFAEQANQLKQQQKSPR